MLHIVLNEYVSKIDESFNGHPPLGVNATVWHFPDLTVAQARFQWAPTLGGECYMDWIKVPKRGEVFVGFNGHPPLGVNATEL